jgi:S1-C subfamily serine protease
MADQEQFSWTCPACGRRVPKRVNACRCGHEHFTVEYVAAAPEAATETGRTNWPLVIVGAAVVSVGAYVLLPLRATEPPATETIVSAPAVPQQIGDVPHANAPADEPTVVPVTPLEPARVPAAHSPAPGVSSLEDMVSNVVPAVVSIQAGRSRGTGFYVRPDIVVTNVHVIDGHGTVDVISGDTKRNARVMRTSPGADLAVLHVYNPNPQQAVLRLGTASGLRVGQEVVAVGSALGVLSNTVTRGIVSAVRRAGDVTLVQTDAAINPGNSGGPLVDRAGQVIGVNTMKIAQHAESIGFAVAIDHARSLLDGQSSNAPAPVNGLNEIMRSGAPTQGDQLRNDGEQKYAAVVEWAADGASQIDEYWQRSARTCVASSTNAGDRAWFAVYEPNGVRLTSGRRDCDSWLENVKTNAEQIRIGLRNAGDEARRSGVYPGTLRDLRRKKRLDWSGFER